MVVVIKVRYLQNCNNDKVALYGIGGEFTDTIHHWEVDIIYIRNDKYGEREHIAKNDDFGRDRSRCFMDKKLDLKYYGMYP